MKPYLIVCCQMVVALLILGTRVGAATAGTIIQGPDTQGPLSGSTTGSFVLPQFDTLGGTRTLTDVTVEVIIDSFDGKREFDNQSGTGGLVTLAIGSSVRVKGPIPGVGSQIIVIPNAVTTASTTITGTTAIRRLTSRGLTMRLSMVRSAASAISKARRVPAPAISRRTSASPRSRSIGIWRVTARPVKTCR